MAKRAKVTLYKAENKEFSWRVRAPNGEIIAIPGETFKTKDAARTSFGVAVKHMVAAYTRLVEEKNKNG